MDNAQKKYEVIVIGSGIGGLVSALVLAKNGKKVCVLEKNQQIGGALQVFSRDKRIFDTGVHYLGGLDVGENLYQIFKYLDILNDLNLVRLDDDFDIIRMPNGKQLKIGQGYDKFESFLVEEFPEEVEAIQKFISKVKEICTCFPLYNLRLNGEKTYYNYGEILTESAWEFVSNLTTNKELIAAFLGNAYLYAGDKKRTPMYVVALILNSYIKGSYRIADGGAQLVKALVKQLRANGVDLFKRKEVIEGMKSDDGLLSSVRCSDGTSYVADHFISNLHPGKTIEVIGEKHFLPATTKRIKGLKNTVGSFVVSIALKDNSFPYMNHNYYDFFKEEVFDTADYNLEKWPEVIFSCTSVSSKQTHYADSFSAMAYLSVDEFEKWTDSSNTVVHPVQRGSDYEALKSEFEQRLLNRLFERFPNLENAILSVHSSTPLTFRDYLGTPEGELYGIEKDFNNAALTSINPRTKVKNLYLTGQSIVFHGILGSTIGALVTSFNLVEGDKILREINRV